MVSQFYQGYFVALSKEKREQLLEEICAEADCIIVPGSHVKADGSLSPDLELRCAHELSLRLAIRNYKHTILSGGQLGVSEDYLKNIDSAATEASLMKQYFLKRGGIDSRYIEEPFALDTLSNVVFLTRLLFDRNLSRPVFISQFSQLGRIQPVATHWFGDSGIKPFFWQVHADNPAKDIQTLVRDTEEAVADTRRGIGHTYRFTRETHKLVSTRWESNYPVIEAATRWLYENVLDGKERRYERYYGTLENLLTKVFGK